jgi:hypothetical protein
MSKNLKNTVYFDVDDTLVFRHCGLADTDLIKVRNLAGLLTSLKPNHELIKRLKLHYNAGHTVIVWSQGGSDWAEAVCNALQIDSFVHLYQDKPLTYYDDLEASYWLKRSFLGTNKNEINNKDIPLKEWESWKEVADENS